MTEIEHKLSSIAKLLINQENAKIIVPSYEEKWGFWFGGGNVIEFQGELYACGRYRNFGDSRTGVGLGTRGLEFAIFKEENSIWKKILSIPKSRIGGTDAVLSFEGSAMFASENGVELYLSSEKQKDYPENLKEYQKEGTGVWTIEHFIAKDPSSFIFDTPEIWPFTQDPEYLHAKDPVFYSPTDSGNNMYLIFCTHPFGWSSCNSSYIHRKDGHYQGVPNNTFFPRGAAWDVAISRITSIVDLPNSGILAGDDIFSLVFYDGGECLRDLEQHSKGKIRPRGFSCDELGGVAYIKNGDLSSIKRLSVLEPYFVSPYYKTGCSRYVDVFYDKKRFIVTWQQAQTHGNQPLVLNEVSVEKVLEELNSI